MIPFPASLPERKADEAAAASPAEAAAVRAPAPGSLAALFAAIKREHSERLRAQEIARQRAAAPQRMRPWEMVGLFAGAFALAYHYWPSEPAPTATAADKPPYGIARGVIRDTRAYGCPEKADIEKMRELIQRAPGTLAWMIYGDRRCVRFAPGDAVVIDQYFMWDAMYLARRPGDLVNLYFAEGIIDREKAP